MELSAKEIERLLAGVPVKEIARERGVSRQSVQLALRQRGISLRELRPKPEPRVRLEPVKSERVLLFERLLAKQGLPFEIVTTRTGRKKNVVIRVAMVYGKSCRLHVLRSKNQGIGHTQYAATNIGRSPCDFHVFYVETSQPPLVYIVPTKALNPRRKKLVKVYIPVEGFSYRTRTNRWWEKWRDAWHLLKPETGQEAA